MYIIIYYTLCIAIFQYDFAIFFEENARNAVLRKNITPMRWSATEKSAKTAQNYF
jgi:hypothetical protein